MKTLRFIMLLLVVVLFQTCETTPSSTAAETPLAPAAAPKEGPPESRKAPDELFGDLFRQVQMQRVFADGKTFVDMIPKASADEIMAVYTTEKRQAGFNLEAFVGKYFSPPAQPESGFTTDPTRSISEHINALWPFLTRKAGTDEGSAGSLIPLPNDYVVPGGRFREVYYWDSYFTLLGLQAAGKGDLVRDMVENFAYLIDEVGHIPNGNRTYYLTRSQPPFFALMVEVLAEMEGEEAYAEFMPQLMKELRFWTSDDGPPEGNTDNRLHLVYFAENGRAPLYRYYDKGDRPRAESYREDVLTIRESGRDSQTVARHLRSGAESGWDYSARWFADGKNISSIITTDIVPPDLNSLIWKLESVIATYHPSQEVREAIGVAAENHRKLINQVLWNEKTGWFEDYNWKTGTHTGYLSLAGVYPLFVGLANERQAALVGERIAADFLAPGGLRTSLVDTDQQWDAPNGWPPLQWMAYQGLKNYNENSVAAEIRKRWMTNNERVYANVNKMVEKYNVEDISLEAGGGEYPVQDGFGWSNGVYLRMATEGQ